MGKEKVEEKNQSKLIRKFPTSQEELKRLAAEAEHLHGSKHTIKSKNGRGQPVVVRKFTRARNGR